MKKILLNAAACIALVAGLMSVPAAHAGRSCEAAKLTPQTVARAMTLAARTLASLNESGQKVVFLARAGQDLRKYGVYYSHVGIAYQVPDAQGGQTWRVLHKLNECGTASSSIYRQGLGEFFLDDLWRFEAAWMVPTPQVQQQLLAMLKTPGRETGLHHKPYSIVSYAWGKKYQQSNQWAIETLAASMDARITTREQAQAWLQSSGYQPAALTIGPMARLGGRLGTANVAFDDHPPEKRFSDRIETVTVDSVFAWLQSAQLALPGAPVLVSLP